MNARRLAALAVSVSVLTLIPLSSAGANAIAGLSPYDRQLLADVNAARIQHGIDPLNVSNHLTPIAQQWSQQIAGNPQPGDNPHLRGQLNATCPKWRLVGENVGIAGESSAQDLFNVYMANAGERQEILDPRFTSIAVSSVAMSDGGVPEVWNVMDFANHCS
jgi:uncharacterized protein YkwD